MLHADNKDLLTAAGLDHKEVSEEYESLIARILKNGGLNGRPEVLFSVGRAAEEHPVSRATRTGGSGPGMFHYSH